MARPIGGRLSDAFRQAYQDAGLTQTEVAAALQQRGWRKVEQSLVSKWARGMAKPPLEVLPDLDDICGVPLGTILHLAGFVADAESVTVEQAIRLDPDLTADDRRTLLGFYEFALSRSVTAAR